VLTVGAAARARPERVAVVLAGGAWLATAAVHGAGGHGGVGHPAGATGPGALGHWALMCVAMMVPVALPAVRHVAANSLRRRRGAAVVQFLAAYLLVWVAFGALVLAALPTPAHWLLPVALGLAAVWQVQPWLRWFLWACHRTVPLPPRGWRAVRGSLRFGFRHGLVCVGVCWPFMLAMAALTGASGLAQVAWMAVLAPLAAITRLVPRSRGWGPPMAVGLATFAVLLASG
jgi:predicted metal-binding membrane protein